MRKLTMVGLLLMGFVGLAMGQVTLSLPDTTAAVGASLSLPLRVTGFNHVGSVSLTISFDKNVLTYTGVANQPSFGVFNSTPITTANTNGAVSISWFNIAPALNFGTGKLLDLLFTYNGGTSNLTFTNTTPSSVTDSIGNNLTQTYTNGRVSGLPTRLTLGTVATASPGDTVLIPLSGDNLRSLGSISLKIAYSTASVNFVGLRNNTSPGFTSGASGGVITLAWFSVTPFSLSSGKMADLVFTFIKDSTDLTFQGTSQVTDSAGSNVTMTYVNGKISKVPTPPPPPVGISIGTVKGLPGTDVSVPVNVQDMNNIGSLSLKINYDAAKLTFKRIDNFTPTVPPTAVGGVLTVAWFSTTPLRIGTGKLMDMVFGYSAGTSALTFNTAQSQATDSAANTLTITFTSGAVNQDSLPKFTAIATQTVAQGDSLSFTVAAADADAGDVLTYSAGTLPQGAGFNATTKAFGWRPSYTQLGSFTVWFYVTDQVGGKDSTSVAITVTKTNLKPTIAAISAKTVAEADTLTFTVSATDLNPGDVLTYSASGVPTGASFDATARAFTWVPAYGQAGSYSVTFKVTDDGGLSDSAVVAITVSKTNLKPTLATVAAITKEEKDTVTIVVSATDPNPGEVLTYSATNVPTGATFIAATRTFAWVPTIGQAGSYAVTFKVTDSGGLSDSTVANITIKKLLYVANPIADMTLADGARLRKIKLTAAPAVFAGNEGTLSFTATSSDTKFVTVTILAGDSLQVRGLIAGSATVTVTATDAGDGSKATASFKVTVTGVSDVPVVEAVPTEYQLSQNYPNPFNPSTTIRFALPKEAPVTLEIYNILGVKVRTLIGGQQMSAAFHSITWDGKDNTGSSLPSGIYLYRIQADKFQAAKKMMLLK